MASETAALEHFRLMDLPAELIIRIVKFAAIRSSEENPIRLTVYQSRQQSAPPAILRTCRFFRNEGLKLFYTSNVFLMVRMNLEIYALEAWMDWISQDYVALLRHAYLRLSWQDIESEEVKKTWASVRSDMIKLNSFHYSLRIAIKMTSGKIVLKSGGALNGCCHVAFAGGSQDGLEWMDMRDVLRLPFEPTSCDWWTVEEYA